MAEQGWNHFSFTPFKQFLWAAKKMAAPILEEFGLHSKPATIDADALKTLKWKLDKISATIIDVENLDVLSESVKLWLSELRDLECMAIDILEEFEYEVRHSSLLYDLSLELCTSTAAGKRHEVSFFPPSPDFSCLCRKLEVMTERCEEVAADREALRLRRADGIIRNDCATHRLPSTCLLDGELHGRKEELEEVVKMVVSEEPRSDYPYSVVSVSGMAGIGKTTLVKHVYNHNSMESRFDLKVWVCAVDGFDVIEITKAMVVEITKQPCNLGQLNTLQELVGHLLAGKRFLLVLDELWDLNREHWEGFQIPLRKGNQGSKVVVTSQCSKITSIMATSVLHNLNCLPDDICWSICRSYAFVNIDRDSHHEMSLICKDIVKKCKGLPLAAKALGISLNSDFSEEKCRELLENELFTDEVFAEETLLALRPSYNHLPVHLKRCFAYCSLFPKGYIFEKHKLVRLWMAQGFIVPNQASRSQNVEDIGAKYFDELVERSIFQSSPYYAETEERYVMQDFFHELAQLVSDKEFCRSEDYKLSEIHHRTRHSSLSPCKEHAEKLIQLELLDGQDLRSLLFIGRLEYKLRELSFNIKIAENLFMRLECLRALDLKNTDIDKLPISIGSLKHLRYLCLKNTRIRILPDSICNLHNLHTLDLRHCYHLEELPKGMKLLSNLVHLQLPMRDYLNVRMPSGVGKLTRLQTMSAFIIGNDRIHCGLSELKDLVNLRGELRVCGLNYVTDAREAEEANMKSKEKLQKLTLQWFWLSGSVGEAEFRVLENLQPPLGIEVLNIRDYHGNRFPEWMGNSCYSRLISLSLQECSEFHELPPLGKLPSLKYLIVEMTKGVRHIGREFCRNYSGSGFRRLESLEFRKMLEWIEWSGVEDGDFPCLQSLVVSGCPKLEMLPKLHALRELVIHCCEKLHTLPTFSSLVHLKVTGYQCKEFQVSELPKLEILEIAYCEQLVSVSELQHLSSLLQLKVTKCPKLDVQFGIKPSLSRLVIYVDEVSLLLRKLSSYGFESTCCHKEGNGEVHRFEKRKKRLRTTENECICLRNKIKTATDVKSALAISTCDDIELRREMETIDMDFTHDPASRESHTTHPQYSYDICNQMSSRIMTTD